MKAMHPNSINLQIACPEVWWLFCTPTEGTQFGRAGRARHAGRSAGAAAARGGACAARCGRPWRLGAYGAPPGWVPPGRGPPCAGGQPGVGARGRVQGTHGAFAGPRGRRGGRSTGTADMELPNSHAKSHQECPLGRPPTTKHMFLKVHTLSICGLRNKRLSARELRRGAWR